MSDRKVKAAIEAILSAERDEQGNLLDEEAAREAAQQAMAQADVGDEEEQV